MQVCAIFSLRTEAVLAEFLAFALVAEVEGVRELAGVAFLAEAALVVFANQVADATAIFFGDVVSVGTEGALFAFAGEEILADGAGDFGRGAERGENAGEESVKGERRGGCGLGVEDLCCEGVCRLGVCGGHGV